MAAWGFLGATCKCIVPFQAGCFLRAFFCWESALVTCDAHGGRGCREKDMLKALARLHVASPGGMLVMGFPPWGVSL